jgi:hypothetical protein
MRFPGVLFFLLVNGAIAQNVQPEEAVITITGFCSEQARFDETCKTIITRGQFEKLAEALQPDLSPAQRLTVANAYARNVRMAAVAEQRGIDKTVQFEQQMRYARLQVLAQDLTQSLQEESNRVSDADVKESYLKNQPAYEVAVFERIMIPHAGRIQSDQKSFDSAAMTRVASEIRARVIQGEDCNQLQQEVYAMTAASYVRVNTKIENVRRESLPPKHEIVMDMTPGEVSAIISDPAGAHFVYKMVGKRTLALDEVRGELTKSIAAQRYRASMNPFQGDVVFSDNYFNPALVRTNTSDQKIRAGRHQPQSGE